MGISPIDYERMRSRTERKRHSPAQAVKDEIVELHVPILAWLKANGVAYQYSRPDKKTRAVPGAPDFFIAWRGKILAIECKAADGELSPPQLAWGSQAYQQQVSVYVVWQMQQFYELVRT